ncbi:periphilin-1 isoform X2 [Hoplias malabaricus]|uniref:periphilin-1 isoform X2 n=1 Tax=Hoplias malabaricus TaxID=27720 RepID=UPI0034623C71
MAYRRERNSSIREMYEERLMGRSLHTLYPRMVNAVDRRPHFNRQEDDYTREADYGRVGGGYQGDDQRAYQGERASYSGERRGGPPYRREDPYFYYRGSGEEPPSARAAEFRNSSKVSSQPSIRSQRAPPPRPYLNAPFRGDDNVKRSSVNPDRSESLKRKAPCPSSREQSPSKKDVPPNSHTHSSRSYSPECGKNSHSPPPPKKIAIQQEKERPPSNCASEPQDASPHSSVLTTKEEMPGAAVEQGVEKTEDAEQTPEARRAHAIANKALEIEKLYRQDCETFGMVVKMLIDKQPTLQNQLQMALKENLTEIKERCLEDLRHFISEVNVVLKSDQ